MIAIKFPAVRRRECPGVIRGDVLRGTLPGLMGVLLMGLSVLLWVWDYLARERVFYFWDSRFYHDLASSAWQHYQQSWTAYWQHLHASMAGDYNALFSVPLMPLFQGLGDSREVFILGLVLCYLLPVALFTGWLAAHLSPDRRWLSGWWAGLAMLAQPGLWYLTLVGLPGAGAVLLLGLAAAVYLADPALRRWRTPLWVGLFTALAILFRRHYGYAVVALYLAMAVVAALQRLGLVSGGAFPGAGWRVLGDLGMRLGLAVLALLGVMLALAPQFTREALTTDYGALYAGYQFAPGQVLRRWREAHGDLLLGLAGLGLLMSLWYRRLAPAAGLFLGLWVLFWSLQWALLVRQLGVPHVVHVLPLVGSLGFGLGVVAAWHRRWSRPLALLMVAVLAVALGNLFAGEDTALARTVAHRAPVFGLVPRPARLHAEHFQQYLALGDYLVRTMAGRPGYVAASSMWLNESLLDNVLQRVVTGGSRPLVLATAHLDSRDWVPLPQLLEAHWVLVTSPPQLHLAPQAQHLITTTVALFETRRGLARDFRPLPRAFPFGDFTVRLYERWRPTPVGRSLETLEFFQQALSAPPGIQSDWVGLDRGVQVQGLVGVPTSLRLALGSGSPRQRPLALSWSPSGERRLQGTARLSGCGAATLAAGSVLGRQPPRELARWPLAERPLAFSLEMTEETAHVVLHLHLERPPTQPCLLAIDGLQLVP